MKLEFFPKELITHRCRLDITLVAQKVKNLPIMPELRFNPWVRKMPWRREWPPTPIFLPGEFHGQRSLVGYSICGQKTVGHD